MTDSPPMRAMDGHPDDEFHPDSTPHPRGKRMSGVKRFFIASGICLVVVAILAGTKFAQISSLIRAGKAAEAAGPPPEAVATDDGRRRRLGCGDRGRRHRWPPPGASRSAPRARAWCGPSASSRGPRCRPGRCWSSWTPASSAPSWRRWTPGGIWPSQQRRPHPEAGRGGGLHQGAAGHRRGPAEDGQRRRGRAEGADRTQDGPRAVRRASWASGRSTSASTSTRARRSPCWSRRSRCSSTSPFPSRTWRASRSARRCASCCRAPPRRGPWTGKIAAVDPSVDAVTRTSSCAPACRTEKDELRPGMFVNVSVDAARAGQASSSVPATAMLRAPYGDSVFVVEPRKDDKGQPVNGPDGKPAKVARQQFVRRRARRAATSWPSTRG